jgi:hypothetical protein
MPRLRTQPGEILAQGYMKPLGYRRTPSQRRSAAVHRDVGAKAPRRSPNGAHHAGEPADAAEEHFSNREGEEFGRLVRSGRLNPVGSTLEERPEPRYRSDEI